MAYIWMLNNFTDFHLTMKDIKTVISLLCNHFNQLFSINLKPEVLRLAKYNKADKKGVSPFIFNTKLLLKLLIFLLDRNSLDSFEPTHWRRFLQWN